MITIKIQMPEGGNLREVFNLIEPSLVGMKSILEGHYSTELAPPIVETGNV